MFDHFPKVNLQIVGCAKCGTSTLATILRSHPAVCFSDPKEINFFHRDDRYCLGLDWYHQHFSHYKNERIIAEATPSYSLRHDCPDTARRIFEYNPKTKIIYMVRDPFQMIFSAWMMHYRMFRGRAEGVHGKEDKLIKSAAGGFHAYLEQVDWDIARYDFQISAYRQYFPENQIHTIFLEDWSSNPKLQFERTCTFLNIDPEMTEIDIELRENTANDGAYLENPFVHVLMRIKKLKMAYSDHAPMWIKQMRSHLFPSKIVQIPDRLKKTELRSAFINHVIEDSSRFLGAYGKPVDFWPSLQMRPGDKLP